MNRILYLHSVYLYSSGSSKKQLSISCIVLLSTATHMGYPAQRFWGTWWSSCRGTACSGAWCLQPPAVGVPCTDLLHVYCSESLNQRASWQCLDTIQWPPAPVPTTPNSGQGEIYRATPWCCLGPRATGSVCTHRTSSWIKPQYMGLQKDYWRGIWQDKL